MYLECPECGIVRNTEEASRCPVCVKPVKGRFAYLNKIDRREWRKKQQMKMKKIGGKEMWCPNCDEIKKGFLRMVSGGGKFRCCPICLEVLKSI